MAKLAQDENGKKFWALSKSGHLWDPVNLTDRDKADFRWKFVAVKEPVFNSYLSYLRGREQRKLREIRRMMVDG